MKKYEVIVRVWNDYSIEVEAESEEEAEEIAIEEILEDNGRGVDSGYYANSICEIKEE